MARIESSDPERMVYRSGGGCLMLFGLPFLLAGVFMIVTALADGEDRPRNSKSGRATPVAVGILMGALFAVAGAGVAFGRGGKILDRRADTLTTWWGLLVPFSRTEHRLSSFDRVTLSREVRTSKNGSYTVYPTNLIGEGVPKVTLEESRDPTAARAVAEGVAKFLNRPLADSSMGEEVVRQVAELDESVRDRSRRTGDRPDVPPPPPGQRCATRVIADTLCIEIPPLGFRKLHAVPLVLSSAVALFFIFALILPIAADKRMPAGRKAFPLAFLGILFVLVPMSLSLAAATKGVRKRKTVEVSPRELLVVTRGGVRQKRVAIPCDELEELAIVPAKTVQGALTLKGEVILARSDHAAVAFGEGLSRDELAWLCAVVSNVVSA